MTGTEDYGVIARWTEERFPKGGKVLWLSLTGSRAFGWGEEKFDYDVHGVYYVDGEYFDYIHYGSSIAGMPVDLNLRSIGGLLMMGFFHPSFEAIMNVSNPVWIGDREAWERFERDIIGNINELFFWRSSVDFQLGWLRSKFHPRTALHTYRVLLQPLYWKEKKKVKMNIFEIVDELGLDIKGHVICKEAYNKDKHVSEKDQGLVWREIEYLDRLYSQAFPDPLHAPSTDWKESPVQRWYDKARKIVDQYLGWLKEKH